MQFFGENIEITGNYRYLNTETGELHDQDPRLGPLPEDIEMVPREQVTRVREDPRIFQIYRNRRTGVEVKSDPRLTPSALESRGVRLERFVLR